MWANFPCPLDAKPLPRGLDYFFIVVEFGNLVRAKLKIWEEFYTS